MNLEQELKDQAKDAEEYQNFSHDDLFTENSGGSLTPKRMIQND